MLTEKCAMDNLSVTAPGKIEESLKILFDYVDKLEKIAESIVCNVTYSSDDPVICQPCTEKTNEPTLRERINQAAKRISDANQRLELANSIIEENLGDIKLD
jgi:hypothetical protein